MNRTVPAQLQQKALFASFHMTFQRADGKRRVGLAAFAVHDANRIDRIKPKVSRRDAVDGVPLGWLLRGNKRPAVLVHSPIKHRCDAALEDVCAHAQYNAVLVYLKSGRQWVNVVGVGHALIVIIEQSVLRTR